MIDSSFLQLKTSRELAQDLGESPIVQNYYYGQIHLLPRETKPYFFVTRQIIGNYAKAYLVNCHSQQEENVTAHFASEFTDGSRVYRLVDLPTDYGQTLVYLKIVSAGRPTLYSNNFKVTNEDKHLTSRLDYRNTTTPATFQGQELFLSVRLGFYLNNHLDSDEIGSYLSLSVGENLLTNAVHTDLKEWIFEDIDAFTHKRLKRVLQSGITYIDFVRNQGIQASEYEGRDNLSNIGVATYVTDPDEEDILDVQDVQVVAVPTANWIFLNGNRITSLNGKNLQFI